MRPSSSRGMIGLDRTWSDLHAGCATEGYTQEEYAQEGYAQEGYVRSLSDWGLPFELPSAQGWVLKRPIDTGTWDAMGGYPVFACADWSALRNDWELLSDCVSLVMVTDPFAHFAEDKAAPLAGLFNQGLVPFKEHFVVDLETDPQQFVCDHHQRNAKKALQGVQVERVSEPWNHLEIWCELYQQLIDRHHIRGMAQFSRQAFTQQLALPGTVLYRASQNCETIGMVWFLLAGEVGYYHLAAYSETGYDQRASFAVFWTALHDLRGTVRWLGLGAGAGLHEKQDGLTRFKKGWSNTTRPTYLGKHVFQPERYHELTRERGQRDSQYFPAYRTPEVAG